MAGLKNLKFGKGGGLNTPPKPPKAGSTPKNWAPGQGTGPVPRKGGRGTNMTRKYGSEDEARNAGLEWMEKKGCGGPRGVEPGKMAFEGKDVGSTWAGGGSVRLDYDDTVGKHYNFQCGDDLFHAAFDEGRIQEVCAECFVQECEKKKNRLLGRGKALRDKPNRDFEALPDGDARDAAVEKFLDGLDGPGGFAEQAEALAGELDEFVNGNCPRKHRRQAEREAKRLRRQANIQRNIAKHYRGIRQANKMARNLRNMKVGSPNFWRAMGHLGRLR